MTSAQQADNPDSTAVATTDGVPTDALQLVIERAEIEADELDEYGEAPDEFVAEVRDAIEAVKAAINDDEGNSSDSEVPIDPERVPDRWEIVAGEPGYEQNIALVWKREGALVPASVIEIRTADNRHHAKPVDGFAVVVRDENADGVADDGMINAQAEYDECDSFEAAVERLYDAAEEYPLPETRNGA